MDSNFSNPLMLTNEAKDVPSSYSVIKRSGRGASSNVYLCINKMAISQALSASEIKSQLVAVKVYDKHEAWTELAEQEVRNLQTITKASRIHGSVQRCQTLLMHDLGSTTWIGTPAILGGMSLKQANYALNYGDKGAIPAEFVCHAFIELTEALNFLHNVCVPPVSHGDLHLGNVLIDVEAPRMGHPGFPRLKLIDFGGQLEKDDMTEQTSIDADRDSLYLQLMEMYSDSPECYCNEVDHRQYHDVWEMFGDTLNEESSGPYSNPMSIQEIWELYREWAVSLRQATPRSVLQRIKDVVLDSAEADVRHTEQLIYDKIHRR
ncbi:kinase-like protein [Lophiostoma macrostomum CBS 122681]|uniref:Kinase-like protein n=1 Tax=Lophiostoma macrostomum CBS 122681 TaxID=1314788 RepID=A0A6A6ST42_9PLEO|nr:kinase-like protein [Lophiostoma macrostomum CBS 122681]